MDVRPGYKRTEVGVIPDSWSLHPLGELGKWLSGGTPSMSIDSYWSGEFPWVSSKDMKVSRLHDSIDHITSKAVADGARLVPAGAVLIVIRGMILAHSFPVGRAERSLAFNQDIKAVIVGADVDSNFLLYWLMANAEKLRGLTTESTHGTKRLPTEMLFRELVACPPPLEQEAIAEALSDADALIESLEQLLTKKRQIKKGAMQELLTGRKRLPGFSGEWQTRQLGEVINHCSSGATPYRGRPDYYTGTVTWITSGELNYNVITDTIEHISEEAVQKTNLKIHPAGTFLMAITGLEAAGTRGACGIVGSPATTNQSCMAIYPSIELKTAFLYHYYVMRGNELALQYCQGTKQQSYTAKLVRLLPIDLPPTIQEQTAIATILSDVDEEIAALEAKLSKARQLKQGMMQELLTGKVRLV